MLPHELLLLLLLLLLFRDVDLGGNEKSYRTADSILYLSILLDLVSKFVKNIKKKSKVLIEFRFKRILKLN